MPDLASILLAALTGCVSGLVLSIPVGPVNLTIINEGARRGFQYAFLVGLGATLMETIYCSLAFTGLAGLVNHGTIKFIMQVLSFAFMIYLGTKFLLAKSVPHRERTVGDGKAKVITSSAFMTGFSRVLANPGILLVWIIVGQNFMYHEWVKPEFKYKLACILGVALGTDSWFTGVGYAVSLGHRKFSDHTLIRLSRGSGIGLLLLGVFNGCQIIWELTHPHRLS